MRRTLLTLLGFIFIPCCGAHEAMAQQYGWSKVADLIDLYQTTAIEFADSLNGWLGVMNANAVKAIYKTSDGGHTWQTQLAPLALNVRSISFVNALQGWTVGDLGNAFGYIIQTTDGGKTWTEQRNILHHLYASGSAQTTQQAVTVGRLDSFLVRTGLVARTTNGGSRWQEQRLLTRIDKVEFVDQFHGWAIAVEGDSGSIIHTRNGSLSWTLQHYDREEVIHLSGISFVDSLHGWGISVLEAPWLLRTTNGGKTWEKFYKFGAGGRSALFNDICFADSLNGWLCGNANYNGFVPIIFRTPDGGRSWRLEFADLETPNLFGAVDIVALDQHLAWAISYTGEIYKYGLVTAVKEHDPTPPLTFSLSQNYPNPFNARTIIHYQLPKRSHVELRVYDAMGRAVRTLVNHVQPPGRYNLSFEGSGLASGIYRYTLKAENFEMAKSMLFLE